jgi:adenylate cyclase
MADAGHAIFLSYASQDAGSAQRICDALRKAGVEVWFDTEGGLEHGDAWDATIRRQIRDCALFMPIISANTQARLEGYFRIEWELAAQRSMGIAIGVPFLLPVLIDATAEPDALVPDRFRMVQWTRLPGGEVPPDIGQRILNLWSQRTRTPGRDDGGLSSADRFTRKVADVPPTAGGAVPRPTGRPSIAVMPFHNISGDPEQEYFSDGITEDLITDLSKISALHVASRNTVFTYKGRSTRADNLARELEVNFILDGSVRKAGNKIRITAQLLDGLSGEHVWADRYDRDLTDIFAIQDDITNTIIEQLKLRLLPDERKAVEQRDTGSAEAYQMLLMARHYRYSNTISDTRLALRFAQRAVEIDPGYAEAWALIAVSQIALLEMTGRGESGLAACEKALALNPRLATAHAAMGRVLGGLGKYEEALAAHDESLRLNPDSYEVNFLYGRTCTEMGHAEAAIRHHEKAAALSQNDYMPLALVIQSYNELGRREEAADASRRALERIEQAIRRRPDDTGALYHGASVLADLGERDRAIEWANRAILMAPDEARGIYLLACTFALLGETEKAIDCLEQSIERMQPGFVTWAKNDSDLRSLRDHPRYKVLIQRLENSAEPTS